MGGKRVDEKCWKKRQRKKILTFGEQSSMFIAHAVKLRSGRMFRSTITGRPQMSKLRPASVLVERVIFLGYPFEDEHALGGQRHVVQWDPEGDWSDGR